MEKNFWNHLGLLLAAVIGVGFLLTCIGIGIFFFNYKDDIVSMFGTLAYAIIFCDNISHVITRIKKYLDYQKLNR
jgi:hypothetical protein